MPKKTRAAVVPMETAAPPRATSGRRYKALTTWRFQPRFVRKSAPAASVGGSGAKGGCGSATAGSGCTSAGGPQSRRGARGAALEGSVAVKAENVSPRGAEKDHQLTTGVHIVTVDSSCRDRSGGADKDRQLKACIHIATLDGSDGDRMGSGAEMDSQLKRGTRGAAAKSSGGEKMESAPSSGAEKDCQSKRATRSATAKSSCAVKLESDGAEMDCQLKRHTRSATAKSSCNGEKMENCAHSGAEENSQSKRGTQSATVKSSSAEKMENGTHSGAKKDCGLGKSSGNIMGGAVGTAAGGDCDLGGSTCNGAVREERVQNLGTCGNVGAGDGAACTPVGIWSNAGAENCMSEGSKKSCVNGSGLKSNGSSAADRVGEEPEGNGGSTGGAVKESEVAAKGCSSAGPWGDGNGSNCRRGRKELVPWRFKVGYKRSFSKAFCSSSGSLDTPEYRAQGSSTQCTPGTRSTVRCYASPHSSVRVSAVRNFSSGKSEKETRAAHKKLKTENDDHIQGMPKKRVSLARETVMRPLQIFRLIYKNLLDELEHKSKEAPDLQAYKIFRDRFSAQCDDKKYVGKVPGIRVGDIFHIRVELCIVGLHRPHRIGIDHIKEEDGTCIAISIVAYAQFSDVKRSLDSLVYSGSTTATANQKIDGTNLALKKSMDTNTPVRVIHGFSSKGNSQRKNMLIYGGLYLVEKYWREKESEDRYVYMFRLRRIAGQKHIDIEEILETGQAKPDDSVIMKDLSEGLEKIPISVVNSISDEKPMPYTYMTRLKYPHNYQPAPPAGCGCVGGCSDRKPCACVVKNGGEVPFNDKGCIIAAKPLVYECGPSCKCPPTCHNRVGQKGIKFRLQVFKTKSMGWGVKTLDFIPSGSFVCEYIGEILHDEEAQTRMDEYLFAIGHNYHDETLWEGLSRSIPSLQKCPGEDDGAGFAVDASKMGNFAKFINHNCTPNLYAQNVLYDHDDKSAPHVMFFACEDIPPGQELAYHYNYAIDQVYDANGNIKKKKCLCGSFECDDWLY